MNYRSFKNKHEFTWTWTNWTFGIWWDGFIFGIDLGPLEYTYMKHSPYAKRSR